MIRHKLPIYHEAGGSIGVIGVEAKYDHSDK